MEFIEPLKPTTNNTNDKPQSANVDRIAQPKKNIAQVFKQQRPMVVSRMRLLIVRI
jgi:hypothetical protein